MTTCPECSQPIDERQRFCSDCGARVADRSDRGSRAPIETLMVTAPSTPAAGSTASPFAHSVRSDAASSPQLDNGTIFGDRYRIVERLGRGGMGDVYRADDLRLGESVALKLLSPQLGADPANLARLHHEVRIARQVTHGNVCRIHDLGEVAGLSFISMEYIDGEDLATLLRRIGRFPSDRGVEIVRQLCAGLAAAHERGVLHRDLKPANIMIDGRGQVRIADFGIASIADHVSDEFAGTPAYMAPELFEGEPASVRSDLYSLGLVIFEIFTGRTAIEGETFDAVRSSHLDKDRPRASTHVARLDPAIERILDRCLARDPKDRPRTVADILGGLPGVDVLAAAVAAGETPSPELVAAARGGEDPRWRLRIGFAAFVLVGLVCIAWSDRSTVISEIVAPELSGDVLRHRAREILTDIGYDTPAVDSEYGFVRGDWLLNQIEEFDGRPERWQRAAQRQSGALQFWYRHSLRPIVPRSSWGLVYRNDPPRSSEEALVDLTVDGGLLHLKIEPPARTSGEPGVVEWPPIFAMGGLDIALFEPAEATRTPPVPSDERLSWTGQHPTLPDVSVIVNAASYHGRPVYFSQSYTYHVPEMRNASPRRQQSNVIAGIAETIMLLISLIGGVWLGWRNLALRRSDTRNATRLALFYLGLAIVTWALRTHTLLNLKLALSGLAVIVFDAAVAWFLYMALEPTIRRQQPRQLVSWTRLMSGKVRDSLVGFDLLVGVTIGVAMTVIEASHYHLVAWFSGIVPRPFGLMPDALKSGQYVVASVLEQLTGSVSMALTAMFLFIVFKIVGRKGWVAVVLLLAMGAARMPWAVISDFPLVDYAVQVLAVGLVLLAMVRWGLLALSATIFTFTILLSVPLSVRTDAWYFMSTVVVLVSILALASAGLLVRRSPAALRVGGRSA